MSTSNQGGRSGRRGRGRQRVNMARMENESNLQVTFSKRRAGLFKKASELCTLCDVEMGVIVFSPSDKAFSFGHPNINAICDRFLTQDNAPPPPDPVTQLVEAHRTSNIIHRNQDLTNIDNTIESLKRSIKEKEEMKQVGIAQQWYPPPIEDLDFHQLQDLLGRYAHFKNMVENEVQRITNLGNQDFPNPSAGINPSFAPESGGFPVYGGSTLGFPGLVPTGFAGTTAPIAVHESTVPATSFGTGDGLTSFTSGGIPSQFLAGGSDNMLLYDLTNPSNYLVPAEASGGSSLHAAAAPFVPMGMSSMFPTYGMASGSGATELPVFDPRIPGPGEGSSRATALPVFDPRIPSPGEGSSRATALSVFDPRIPGLGEGSSRATALPVFDQRIPGPGEGSSRATALPMFDPRNIPGPGEGSSRATAVLPVFDPRIPGPGEGSSRATAVLPVFDPRIPGPGEGSSRATALPMFDPRIPVGPGEGSSRVTALPVFDPRILRSGEGSSRVTALPVFDPRNPSPGEGSSRTTALPVFDPRNPSPGEGSSRTTALQVFDPRNPSPGEGSGASGSNAGAPPAYGSRAM